MGVQWSASREHAAYWHTAAAISEGLCPVHRGLLEPWPAPPGKIAGHCRDCRRYWGVSTLDEVAGSWPDADPQTQWPAVAVPEFMAWRPDP